MNTPQTFVATYIEAFAPAFLPVGPWTLVEDHWVGWITDFRRHQRVRLHVEPGASAEIAAHIHYGLRYRRHLELTVVDGRMQKRHHP